MQDGVSISHVSLRDQQRLKAGPLTEYSQYGEGIPFGGSVPRAGNDSGGGQPGWILKCKGWENDPDAYIYFITQAPVLAGHLRLDRRADLEDRSGIRHAACSATGAQGDFGAHRAVDHDTALRNVTDGSRNAGAMYAFDTFSISPILTLTYGGRYARYDYLEGGSLISPRVALTLQPADHFRVSTMLSSRALAPGAEEFMPRMDAGIWLPPQRTFSSLDAGAAARGRAHQPRRGRGRARHRVGHRVAARLPAARRRSDRHAVRRRAARRAVDARPLLRRQRRRRRRLRLQRRRARRDRGPRPRLGRIHGDARAARIARSARLPAACSRRRRVARAPSGSTTSRRRSKPKCPKPSTRVVVLYRVSNGVRPAASRHRRATAERSTRASTCRSGSRCRSWTSAARNGRCWSGSQFLP